MIKINRAVAVIIIISVFAGCFYSTAPAADKYDGYPVPENDSLRGKTVFLDAGHGKGNPNGEEGYFEHEGNLTIALLVKKNLERCGADVIMTRPDENDIDSYARMSIINLNVLQKIQNEYIKKLNVAVDEEEIDELQADIDELQELIAVMQSVIDAPELSPEYYNSPWNINKEISSELKRIFEYEACEYVQKNMLFLSIHANAASGSNYQTANGTVTYYLHNEFKDNQKYYTDYAFADQSKTFAELIQQEVVSAGGFRSCGIAVNNFFMLREQNIPAALLEVAFFTNPSDRAKLQSEAYQKRIASGITFSIQEYFAKYGKWEILSGDVNYDGIVTNADVIIIARYLVDTLELIDDQLLRADFNNDGQLDNIDLISLAKYIVEYLEPIMLGNQQDLNNTKRWKLNKLKLPVLCYSADGVKYFL